MHELGYYIGCVEIGEKEDERGKRAIGRNRADERGREIGRERGGKRRGKLQ